MARICVDAVCRPAIQGHKMIFASALPKRGKETPATRLNASAAPALKMLSLIAMTRPLNHHLTVKNVQQAYFQVFFLADEMLRIEKDLIAFLAKMHRDRIELRFGFRSLKKFCQQSLNFTEAQSQRLATEAYRLLDQKGAVHIEESLLLPSSVSEAQIMETKLQEEEKHAAFAREYLRRRIEELEEIDSTRELRLADLRRKHEELLKVERERDLEEMIARAMKFLENRIQEET